MISIFLIYVVTRWSNIRWKVISLLFWLLFIITTLGAGLLPYCDNYANITGLIIGLLCGTLILPSTKWGFGKMISMIISLLLLVALIGGCVTAFIMKIPVNSYCSSYCKYLDCYEFGFNYCKKLNN